MVQDVDSGKDHLAMNDEPLLLLDELLHFAVFTPLTLPLASKHATGSALLRQANFILEPRMIWLG